MPLNRPVFTLIMRTLILSAFSSSAYSVQPMTESDLEVVSATTGDNILNIFGASQAGLKVDSDEKVEPGSATLQTEINASLNKEQFQEGESISDIAAMKLRDIEQKTSSNREPATRENIDQSVQSNAILISESTTKSSSAYSTNSEINYKTANFKHQMRELDNGVAVQRDLQIDLLKLENLKGAHYDERSAGSIYLSDWRSRGDTRIVAEP